MASTNSGTYRPLGASDRQSTERVIWMMVAIVLFLLVFSMGSRTDLEEISHSLHGPSSTLAQSEVRTVHGANGANYSLMRGHR